ncbi:MAG: hypothetical protein ABSH47_12415 [Bryobacteraceae bacterium]|jgi:hypothetical protein
MTGWKRVVLGGLSVGAGFAITFVLVWGGYLWYAARPRPPKPWNASAIRASFDRLDTEGEKNTVVFWYTLENRTDFDLRLAATGNLHMMGKLQQQGSLTPFDDRFGSFDLPIFVPAKQKVRYGIHLDIGYTEHSNGDATLDEKRAYRKRLAAWLNAKLENLNGFAMFDDEDRYQIDFPKGW